MKVWAGAALPLQELQPEMNQKFSCQPEYTEGVIELSLRALVQQDGKWKQQQLHLRVGQVCDLKLVVVLWKLPVMLN